MANAAIIIPEIRFTIFKELVLNFDFRILTTLLRIIHQRTKPRNTPRTIIVPDEKLLFLLSKPRPAKIAANDNIVIGLVMVRKKVVI